MFGFCLYSLLSWALALAAPILAPTDHVWRDVYRHHGLWATTVLDGRWRRAFLLVPMSGVVIFCRPCFTALAYHWRLVSTAVGLQLTLGIIIGLPSAGCFGGRIDDFLMRFADVQLSFSTMMVAIIVSAIFKASFGSDFYAQYAVVMLSEWLSVLPNGHNMLVRFVHQYWLGKRRVVNSTWWASEHHALCSVIFYRTVIANLVISTVQVANAIMSEAALSF